METDLQRSRVADLKEQISAKVVTFPQKCNQMSIMVFKTLHSLIVYLKFVFSKLLLHSISVHRQRRENFSISQHGGRKEMLEHMELEMSFAPS